MCYTRQHHDAVLNDIKKRNKNGIISNPTNFVLKKSKNKKIKCRCAFTELIIIQPHPFTIQFDIPLL